MEDDNLEDDVVEIYHNPRCSKSRATLALLEERGLEVDIIPYLDVPPDTRELTQLLEMLGKRPHEIIRTGEAEYKAMGLDDPNLADEALISAMVRCPKLIERPIVVYRDKAAIGRPPEAVLEIL